MRSEAYCSWVVCLSVCVSVSQHLTSGASVRLENAVTQSVGNEGHNICEIFSETALLQRSGTSCIARLSRLQHGKCASALFNYAQLLVHTSTTHVAIVAKMQSCSASDSSENRVDTPPANCRVCGSVSVC